MRMSLSTNMARRMLGPGRLRVAEVVVKKSAFHVPWKRLGLKGLGPPKMVDRTQKSDLTGKSIQQVSQDWLRAATAQSFVINSSVYYTRQSMHGHATQRSCFGRFKRSGIPQGRCRGCQETTSLLRESRVVTRKLEARRARHRID